MLTSHGERGTLSAQETRRQSGTGGNDLRPLVLIAEDEPYIAESLGFLMEQAGLSVMVVSDGAAALPAIRSRRPAVVILDVMMPKANGLDVLREIRASPDLAGTPVMVLTARGQENDRQAAMSLGADAFVTKPFSNRDVVRRTLELAGLPSVAEHRP